MVVWSTGTTCTTRIYSHLFVCLFGKRHLHALYTLIMSYHRCPVITHFSRFCWRSHQPSVVPCGTTIHIFIISPRQSLYVLRTCSHIFYTCSHAIIHIREQIIALIPCHFANINGKSECHRSMTTIASRFLHLSQSTVCTRFQCRLFCRHHQITDKLRTSITQDWVCGTRFLESTYLVVLHERHTLIIYKHVIA